MTNNDEIFQEFEHKRALSVPYPAAFAQARAQIIDWALGIVGEDEPEATQFEIDQMDHVHQIWELHLVGGNRLRRELRAKLKGERNG